MTRTLIAFVTFGNLEFTKLAVKGIDDTVYKHNYDLFVIVGKPNDVETIKWLREQNIPHKIHTDNYGFPYSLNDIYDYAWKENNYYDLILLGNDVIPYPYAIDSLISLANISDYEVISSQQVDVRELVEMFPETREDFEGETLNFTDFTKRPWDKFTNYTPIFSIDHMKLYDIQNLCLYKREAFDKVGYTDVNFFPAYCVDNDYARRLVNAGVKCCSLTNSRFFHFWSRTIHQGEGGSNHTYFKQNKRYYKEKWGGNFGEETINAELKIATREGELEKINYWKEEYKKGKEKENVDKKTNDKQRPKRKVR